MHMKLWIADQRHVYVGSANMDWLSLSQVKEMGVVAYNASNSVAASAQDYFDSFFSFAQEWGASGADAEGGGSKGMSPEGRTLSRLNPSFGAEQTVPCWEAALTRGAKGQCADALRPSPAAGSAPRWQDPALIADDSAASGGGGDAGGDAGDDSATGGGSSSSSSSSKKRSNVAAGSTYFLSASPVALLGDCGGSAPPDMSGSSSSSSSSSSDGQLAYGGRLADCARTWDEDGLVLTILDAKDSLSLSVMDLLPTNAFGMNTTCSNFGGGGSSGAGTGAVSWTRLLDAVATAVYANGVHARLLVSHWAHSDFDAYRFLQTFAETGAVTARRIVDTNERYAGVPPHSPNAWNGSLEIGVFQVPGWGNTQGNGSSAYDASLPPFPPYSRVNHAKYLVTDRRVNIGTSNYQPSYFYQTAGTSFNSDEPALVGSLQAAFDRDWASEYTTPLAAFLQDYSQQPTPAPTNMTLSPSVNSSSQQQQQQQQ